MAITITILVLTSALALIGWACDLKHKSGKLTLWGWISFVMLCGILTLTIIKELRSEDESNTRFAENILRLDKLLSKADTTFYKIDSSTEIQHALQDSTRKLDSLATDQLRIQSEISYASKKILSKNEDILSRQESTIDNTDRILNPLYPFRIEVWLLLDFRQSGIQPLLDTIFKIKDSMEANQLKKLDKNIVAFYENNKIKELSFGFPDDIFKLCSNFNFPLLQAKHFEISFIKGPKRSITDMRTMLPNFKVMTRYYNVKEMKGSKTSHTSMEVSFEKKNLHVQISINDFTVQENGFSTPLGIRDLRDGYVFFDPVFGDDDYQLDALRIFVGKDLSRLVAINPDSSEKFQNANTGRKVYFHKIRKDEYNWTTENFPNFPELNQ